MRPILIFHLVLVMLTFGCVWDASLPQTWCDVLAVPQHGLLSNCTTMDSCTRESLDHFLPPLNDLSLLPPASQSSVNAFALSMGRLSFHLQSFSSNLALIQSHCKDPNIQWSALQSSQANVLLLVSDVDAVTHAMLSFIQSEQYDLNQNQIDAIPQSPLFLYHQVLQSNRTILLQPVFSSAPLFASRLRQFQSTFSNLLSDFNAVPLPSATVLDISRPYWGSLADDFPLLLPFESHLISSLTFIQSTTNAHRVTDWLNHHSPTVLVSLLSDFASPHSSVASSFATLVDQSIQARTAHRNWVSEKENQRNTDLETLSRLLSTQPAEISPYFAQQLLLADPSAFEFLLDYNFLVVITQQQLSSDIQLKRDQERVQYQSHQSTEHHYVDFLLRDQQTLSKILSDWNRHEWWIEHWIPNWCQTHLQTPLPDSISASSFSLHIQRHYWKDVFDRTRQPWACEKALHFQNQLRDQLLIQSRESYLSKTRLNACQTELKKWWDHHPLFFTSFDTNQLYDFLQGEPSLAQLTSCEQWVARLQTHYLQQPLFLELEPLLQQGQQYHQWSSFLVREKVLPADLHSLAFADLLRDWQSIHDDPFQPALSSDFNANLSSLLLQWRPLLSNAISKHLSTHYVENGFQLEWAIPYSWDHAGQFTLVSSQRLSTSSPFFTLTPMDQNHWNVAFDFLPATTLSIQRIPLTHSTPSSFLFFQQQLDEWTRTIRDLNQLSRDLNLSFGSNELSNSLMDLNQSWQTHSDSNLILDFNQQLIQETNRLTNEITTHRNEWIQRLQSLLAFPSSDRLLHLSAFLLQADSSELARLGYIPPYSSEQITAWKTRAGKTIPTALAKRLNTFLANDSSQSMIATAQTYRSFLPDLFSIESRQFDLEQEWVAAQQLLIADANRFYVSASQSSLNSFNTPAQQFTQKAATSLDQNRFLESIQYSHYALAALAEPGLSNLSIPLALLPLLLVGVGAYYWQRKKKTGKIPRAVEEWKEPIE